MTYRIHLQLPKKTGMLQRTFRILCCYSDSNSTKRVILYKVFDTLSGFDTFVLVIYHL